MTHTALQFNFNVSIQLAFKAVICGERDIISQLQWRHNVRDSVSNHQAHDCLLNRLFGRISKKTSKLLVTGLCAGNSPGTDEFPAQMASNADNVSIWWRHHLLNKAVINAHVYQLLLTTAFFPTTFQLIPNNIIKILTYIYPGVI